jgi:hypothetical protein
MNHARLAVVTFGFVLAVGAPARADDAKAARALVDKAIKAQGGADNLAKYKGSVASFKGTFYGMGMELPMTGVITTMGVDKFKADIMVEAGGMKIQIVNVVNGDKGWSKVGANTTEMDKDMLTQAKEKTYAEGVASLVPLIDGKGYTLAPTGEFLVGEKKALGVKVTSKGRRDVDLYFDKETGLVVQYEFKVKDEGSGQEVTETSYPSEYKDVRGVKLAKKFTVKRDGKLYLEIEMTDIELHDKLDASVFDKP